MKKTNFLKENNRLLIPGISYTIGKFQVLLNEETGDLRILVHTNTDIMKIIPRSENSIILQSCRDNKQKKCYYEE